MDAAAAALAPVVASPLLSTVDDLVARLALQHFDDDLLIINSLLDPEDDDSDFSDDSDEDNTSRTRKLEEARKFVTDYVAVCKLLKIATERCASVVSLVQLQLQVLQTLTRPFLAVHPDGTCWERRAGHTDLFFLGAMLRLFPEAYGAHPEHELHSTLTTLTSTNCLPGFSPKRLKLAARTVDKVCRMLAVEF